MPRETQQGSVGKGHDVGCQRVRSADAGPDQRRTRGQGNDTLLGDPGDDWIDGGTGADTLSGGSGADSFVFRNGDGKERFIDFVNDLDTLVFGGGHWDGAMSIKSFVSTYARASGASVIFDVGDGDVVRVDGIASLSQLYDDILLLA